MFSFIGCSHHIHIFKPLSINKKVKVNDSRKVTLEITKKKSATSSQSLNKFSNIFSNWIALWSLSTGGSAWIINLSISVLVTAWPKLFLKVLDVIETMKVSCFCLLTLSKCWVKGYNEYERWLWPWTPESVIILPFTILRDAQRY